ncbi:hypothetical protein NHP190003_10110 [Helicobacter sp. NHP19-003]|uniref:Uncharacterized protein n=1 Tax=Helicobacter gastrocanis TaxID=2849641 RepID=A0ABN6I542_9HELI|nr:hypothetical protein NHP190003_10110 [Helicobacter sp. NHP19-003]
MFGFLKAMVGTVGTVVAGSSVAKARDEEGLVRENLFLFRTKIKRQLDIQKLPSMPRITMEKRGIAT